jgi:hypothetical protein
LFAQLESRTVSLLNQAQSKVFFTENLGQVIDQNSKQRPDVLFGGVVGNMAFHLRKNGISYQLNEAYKYAKEIPEKTLRYRLDLDWINCNPNCQIKKEGAHKDYNNFYDEPYPNGIHHVKSYDRVMYQEIYPGIDLQFYGKENILKYDFVVQPLANVAQIQLKIKGATKIILQQDGSILIKTPLGEVHEGAPFALQDGNKVNIKWKIKNDIICFEIGDYDKTKILVIDPAVRLWGTLYGTAGNEYGRSCVTDTLGNLYLAGSIDAPSVVNGTIIATTGSHQDTSILFRNGFLVKFDPNGIRIWGTYYGGFVTTTIRSCCIDSIGNIFVAGAIGQGTLANAATSGAHQTTYGGGFRDAFLAKFTPAGVRIWGTYYGGTIDDLAYSCSTDRFGNVFMCGNTNSTVTANSSFIATSGAHQPNFGGYLQDAFLVKFNTNGVRQWGTFYGGGGTDYAFDCNTDTAGNVFMVGWTTSPTGISTPGSQQPTQLGNNENGYLVKFNKNGVRKWGTYYGGFNIASIGSTVNACATDLPGNVFIVGAAAAFTTNVIATSNSYQQYAKGSDDGFVAKFDTSGVRQWGTYIGGTGPVGTECVNDVITDNLGNIYLVGTTPSINYIATPMVHQTTFGGGGNDGFLMKLDNLGQMQWGTYYGGAYSEELYGCALGKFDALYVAGMTYHQLTDNVFASAGCHQPIPGGAGNNDAFLAKFYNCANYPIFFNTTSNWNCPNQSTTITANSAFPNFLWSDNSTNNSIVVSPSVTTSYTVSSSSVFTANCVYAAVVTLSVTNLTVQNSYTVCAGKPSTLTASGANSYTWSTSANTSSIVVTPSVTTIYTVSGNNGGGCVVAKTITVNVLQNPTVSITSYSTCFPGVKTLTATGANSYSWNTSSSLNTATISVGYNTTVVLTVTATAINGCKSTQTGTVTVYPFPFLNVASTLYSICAGGTYTQTAIVSVGGADTYTWSNSLNTSTFITSPTVTTVYSVTGTFTNTGCSNPNPATLSILVTQVPTVSISGGTICNGQCWNLNPSGAAAYSMVGPIVCPSVTTLYNCSGVTNNCPSQNTASVYVTVLQNPTVTISASSNTVCSGETVTLSANGANTYTWNNSSNAQSIVVTPTTSIMYSVIGGSANTCSSTAFQNITVDLLNLNVVSSSSILCNGQTATLTANGASTYTWSNAIQGNQIVISPSVNTTYTVYGTSSFGCDTSFVMTQSVTSCTGINNNVVSQIFSIFPNPCKKEFYFNTYAPMNNAVLVLYNSIGQKVLEIRVEQGENKITTNEFARGLYHCLLISNQKQIPVGKLVVE